uniref:Uncharacterized protein n=1 Tax=Glossina brevipalpis TaxID=37001 RepID=A0A1A9W7Z9_9MUSC
MYSRTYKYVLYQTTVSILMDFMAFTSAINALINGRIYTPPLYLPCFAQRRSFRLLRYQQQICFEWFSLPYLGTDEQQLASTLQSFSNKDGCHRLRERDHYKPKT